MLKRILLALSGTPFTDSAIRHAVELATRHGAEITGVTDMDLARLANVGPVPLGAGAAAHALVEHRMKVTEAHIDEAIARFESACAETNTPHRVVRETGDPFEKLASLWRYHELAVVGLQGLFEYSVVHNPDDLVIQLIKKGVQPILAVAREFRPIRKVLLAYSGSPESARAIKQFVYSRVWPDSEVQIVHFGKGEEGADLLADAAEYCRLHGFDPITEHVDGDPRDKLLPHAEAWGADLIAMGSTARARIFKHLLGDTVLHAIRTAHIPLLLTQ